MNFVRGIVMVLASGRASKTKEAAITVCVGLICRGKALQKGCDGILLSETILGKAVGMRSRRALMRTYVRGHRASFIRLKEGILYVAG